MTNIHIGDKVRVLTVKEMKAKDNVEIYNDEDYGEYLAFLDEDGNELDQHFPIDKLFTSLCGRIFTVNNIEAGGGIDLYEDKAIGFAVTKHMVERIEEEKEMEFKIGDKVGVIGSRGAYASSVGRVGTVVELDSRGTHLPICVRFSETIKYVGDSDWVHYDDVKLLEASEVEFTKEDLKTGMIVKLRGGNNYKVMLDTTQGDLLVRDGSVNGRWIGLGGYFNDLSEESHENFDIMAVYDSHREYDKLSLNALGVDVLWEREKKQDMSDEMVEELESKYKIEIMKL